MTIFTPGLLTVEPKKRLTMVDLLQNEWLQGSHTMLTPLPTPGVLCSTSNALHFQLCATIQAFHMAARDGFRLQDVDKAPLAQRRKKKRSSTDARSSSSDSSNSLGSSVSVSQSPVRQSPVRNLSNTSQGSGTSTGFTPKHPKFSLNSDKTTAQEAAGAFHFGPNRIATILSKEKTGTNSNSQGSAVDTTNSYFVTTSGTKRKLDLIDESISNKDDDNDCIIISDNLPPHNNNNNGSDCSPPLVKKARSSTIVIDW